MYLAAASVAENLAAKYTSSVQKSVGSLSISNGALAKNYADLAERLRAEADRNTPPTPVWAAASKDAKAARYDDTDANLTPVRIGQFDNPGSGTING